MREQKKSRKRKALLKGSEKRVLAKKDKVEAETELKKTVALLDRAAAKGIIHRNKAANKKSKLTKKVNKLS
ncbi:MAG: 30S ribosomal protein S20 [Ignavibacteria bacterium]|nr:30S ribosomal protein S20 [Ignavibacteria bacterium]